MTDHLDEWRQAAYKAVRERDEALAERDRLKGRSDFLREMLNLLSVSYVPTDQVLRWLDRPEPPSAALLAQPEYPLPIRPDGSHCYVSTYCLHGDHEACRLTCKSCSAGCECSCGHAPLRTPATQASAVAKPATPPVEQHGPQFRWILSDGGNDFGRWHELEGDCDACCCGGWMTCEDCGGREHHEPIEKPGGGTMHDWVCQTCRTTPGDDPATVEQR